MWRATCILLFGLIFQSTIGVDVYNPRIHLKRLAFGSCFKQGKSLQLSAWPAVKLIHPQVWLWLGDAVYSKNHSISALQEAYDAQIHDELYSSFINSGVEVEGTWDDHDFGINDAGKEIDHISERQAMFLDFLSDSGANVTAERRGRKGVYRSMLYGEGSQKVKIILLDTRTFRDLHIIPSIGASCAKIPIIGSLTPMLASVIRWFTTTFGITSFHQGDMLGEAQWHWLENELEDNEASFTILVSSIQVLTSAPVFESWGHFPLAKRRLLSILRRHNPKGLVLLSGDVHFAEILSTDGTPHIRHAPTTSCSDVVEVTASGMTHSCMSSLKTKLFCRPVLYWYDKHRLWADSFYLGRNFGSIDIDWEVCPPKLTVRLHDASTGNSIMEVERYSCALGANLSTFEEKQVCGS